MHKEIEISSAAIEVLKNGHMRVFLNPKSASPNKDIILNDGVLELDENDKPVAIYGYRVLWKVIPLPSVHHSNKPVRFNEEESKKYCKRSLSKTEYEKLKFTKKFPFVKKVVKTYWIPNSFNVRYKKVDDFFISFVYNCNVSIYEGEILR